MSRTTDWINAVGVSDDGLTGVVISNCYRLRAAEDGRSPCFQAGMFAAPKLLRLFRDQVSRAFDSLLLPQSGCHAFPDGAQRVLQRGELGRSHRFRIHTARAPCGRADRAVSRRDRDPSSHRKVQGNRQRRLQAHGFFAGPKLGRCSRRTNPCVILARLNVVDDLVRDAGMEHRRCRQDAKRPLSSKSNANAGPPYRSRRKVARKQRRRDDSRRGARGAALEIARQIGHQSPDGRDARPPCARHSAAIARHTNAVHSSFMRISLFCRIRTRSSSGTKTRVRRRSGRPRPRMFRATWSCR